MKSITCIIMFFAMPLFIACGNKKEKTETNGSSPNSTNIESPSQPTNTVNIDNENDCISYLKGKSFIGGDARIEFLSDGNVSVYSQKSGNLVFAGNIEMGSRYGNLSRKLEINAVDGRGKLKLVLGADGKLMDETDFTIYKL